VTRHVFDPRFEFRGDAFRRNIVTSPSRLDNGCFGGLDVDI
jgi:hypothetical protein